MNDFGDDLLDSWWGKLLMAVFCLAVAWAIVVFFQRYEAAQQEEPLQLLEPPWYVSIVYLIGGKWVAAAPFGVFSILLFLGGVQQLRNGKEE